jgi:hypothetical protein
MPGYKRDRRRQVPVCYGDPGVSRHTDSRRDARHDLKRHTGGVKRLGFFGASSKYKGIASLEPDDCPSRPCVLDHKLLDFVLAQGAMPDRLAGANPQSACWRQVQEARASQMIVDHHVGPTQHGLATTGQEAGVARACPNQVDWGRTAHGLRGWQIGQGTKCYASTLLRMIAKV